MKDNPIEPKKQSKISEISCALRNAEEACFLLESTLDVLKGNSEAEKVERPGSEVVSQSEKPFAEVYNGISERVYKIRNRIEDAISIIQDMLI